MSDAHGHHDGHDAKAHAHAHTHAAPEEDPLQTPGWMPLLGLGLLLAGALGIYLFVSPGILDTSSAAASGDAAVAGDAAPAAAAPAP